MEKSNIKLASEKSFIEDLLKEGKIKEVSTETVLKENKRIRNKFSSIKAPDLLTIRSSVNEHICEDDVLAPEPTDDVEAEPSEPIEEPMQEPIEAPVEETGDPVTSAIKALFITSIIKVGSNFKEYNSEAMKDALMKQGVSEEVYNSIGKAFYELDTTSEMFN
jgi:hypothetical protein